MNNSIDIRKIKPKKATVAGAGQEENPGGFWEFLNKDIRFGAEGLPEKNKRKLLPGAMDIIGCGR